MDFAVWLPECDGFDAIWVVVDRLSEVRHVIPSHSIIDAPRSAELFLNTVVLFHGLPLTVVSDRGLLFTTTFWGQICNCLGINRSMSTACHPEMDS